MAAKSCPWGLIWRFVSSYITVRSKICECMHPFTPKHTLCVKAVGSETPLPWQVPILSNSGQRGPKDKALTRGYTHKTLECREKMEKNRGKRFEIYECEQGVLIVWDMTDVVCAGRGGISGYHPYLPTPHHTHTHRKTEALHSMQESVLALVRKWILHRERTALVICSDRTTLRLHSPSKHEKVLSQFLLSDQQNLFPT